MMKLIDDILSLRASGHVKRWHTVPRVGGEQSVAEHSAQALSLLFLLHPNPSINLVKAVLWHDSAERLTGDLPAPIKRKYPEIRNAYMKAEHDFLLKHHAVLEALSELTSSDVEWLKVVDVLELLLESRDQMLLGNRHAANIAERARSYLHDMKLNRAVKDFLAYLDCEEPRSIA
jgi:5'-deoxynucleotidase YfbR-like HD superfamily hydrolase